MVLELVALLVVQALFFATFATIGSALLWALLVLRKTPVELLQLRVFHRIADLRRGLVFLAAGTFAGLISLTPLVLQIPPPRAWTLAWTILWSLPTVYGVWVVGGTLRIREAKSRAPG